MIFQIKQEDLENESNEIPTDLNIQPMEHDHIGLLTKNV